MEVLHERNAHNFPLDLAGAQSTPAALSAPAIGRSNHLLAYGPELIYSPLCKEGAFSWLGIDLTFLTWRAYGVPFI